MTGFDIFWPAAKIRKSFGTGPFRHWRRRPAPETFNVLRIEAGTPIYGIDIDENRFVMEVANAARAVCYTKGCFIGQEPIVMSRDRAGQVNRLFLGMKVLDGGSLLHGTKLTRDGVEVGIVTSSCDSPRLGAPLALAYLKRPHIEKGFEIDGGYAGCLKYSAIQPQGA